MIKTYWKIAPIQAERFDASAHQLHKYPIRFEQSGGKLETLEGNLALQLGDWIATGVDGEYWAIKDEIFHETYAERPKMTKIKLFDLFSDKNDVRKYIQPMVDDEDEQFLLDEYGIDSATVETVLDHITLCVDGAVMNGEIEVPDDRR